MADLITAYGGAQLPINSLDQVFEYAGDNSALSNTVEYQGITYTQSYIRDGDNNVVEVTQYMPVPMFERDDQGRLTKIRCEAHGRSLEKRIQWHPNGKISITTVEMKL